MNMAMADEYAILVNYFIIIVKISGCCIFVGGCHIFLEEIHLGECVCNLLHYCPLSSGTANKELSRPA